jgi:hypothetical protein
MVQTFSVPFVSRVSYLLGLLLSKVVSDQFNRKVCFLSSVSTILTVKVLQNQYSFSVIMVITC